MSHIEHEYELSIGVDLLVVYGYLFLIYYHKVLFYILSFRQ